MKKAALGALLGATMLVSMPSAMAATNLTSAEVVTTLGLQAGVLFRVAETTYGQFLLDLGNLMSMPDSYAAVKTAFGADDGDKVSVRYAPPSGRGWSTVITFSPDSGGTVATRSSSGAPGLFTNTPAVAPGPIAGAGLPAVLALLGVGGFLARRRSQSV